MIQGNQRTCNAKRHNGTVYAFWRGNKVLPIIVDANGDELRRLLVS